MWRGISYPVRQGDKGLFNEASDVDLIQGNILQILGTRKGERVMLPEFGSRIMDFIFEPLDHATCALIRFEAIRAIKTWEPRIILNKKLTRARAYPSRFAVVLKLRYYLKPRSEIYKYSVEISRTGGVRGWLG